MQFHILPVKCFSFSFLKHSIWWCSCLISYFKRIGVGQNFLSFTYLFGVHLQALGILKIC